LKINHIKYTLQQNFIF